MSGEKHDAKITEVINAWARAGWEPVTVVRPGSVGPVGILLRKG
jgi:hypothetical protein